MKMEEISPPSLRSFVETQCFVYESLVAATNVLGEVLEGVPCDMFLRRSHAMLVEARERMESQYGLGGEE